MGQDEADAFAVHSPKRAVHIAAAGEVIVDADDVKIGPFLQGDGSMFVLQDDAVPLFVPLR